MKIDELNIDMDIDNKTLCEIFQCSPQGGMRRSLKTNSLVLISNKIHSVYNDLWKGDIFLYTGMGQKGDQNLNFMQNKTLSESNSNGVTLYMFEVRRNKFYTYCGIMKLIGSPYTAIQKDITGNNRKVYIFPLKKVL